jgi:hypothetical protein
LICFHCQQSAEKYLKALLIERGIAFPKTHRLEDLLRLLLPHDASLKNPRRTVVSLTMRSITVIRMRRPPNAKLRLPSGRRQRCAKRFVSGSVCRSKNPSSHACLPINSSRCIRSLKMCRGIGSLACPCPFNSMRISTSTNRTCNEITSHIGQSETCYVLKHPSSRIRECGIHFDGSPAPLERKSRAVRMVKVSCAPHRSHVRESVEASRLPPGENRRSRVERFW